MTDDTLNQLIKIMEDPTGVLLPRYELLQALRELKRLRKDQENWERKYEAVRKVLDPEDSWAEEDTSLVELAKLGVSVQESRLLRVVEAEYASMCEADMSSPGCLRALGQYREKIRMGAKNVALIALAEKAGFSMQKSPLGELTPYSAARLEKLRKFLELSTAPADRRK